MKTFLHSTAIALIALTAASASFAQDEAHADNLDEVVATVNGEELYVGDVLALLEQVPAEFRESDDAALFPQLVEQLVSQKLLADEAQEDDVRKYRIRQAERSVDVTTTLDNYVAANLTDEYKKSIYDEMIGNAPDEPEWSASHILVESEDEAKAVIVRLDAGEDFADLAKELSKDPGSGASGGSLGFFGPGQMVPEFETAVAALELGATSAPVQSNFGWHVIRLDEERVREKPSYEQVLPQLDQFATQQLMDEKISSIREGVEIEITEGVDPSVLSKGF